MTDRIRANIQVGANWEEFKQKCRANNSSASQEINRFINAYLAKTETIASNADPSWIEDRTRQLVREELPPTLKAMENKINATIASQIEQLKSDLAQNNSLDCNMINATDEQDSSLKTNVNRQPKRFTEANIEPEITISSPAEKSDPILEEEIKSKSTDNSTDNSDLDTEDGRPSKASKLERHELSSRKLAKIVDVHHTTLTRWLKRWDRLEADKRQKLEGYEPNERGKWEKHIYRYYRSSAKGKSDRTEKNIPITEGLRLDSYC